MKRPGLFIAGILLVVAAALPAQAQPESSIRFRLGGFFPEGDSDFWRVNEAVFTLDHSDFNDPMIGGSFVTGLTNHAEIGFNIDFYDSTVRSAERDFVDQDGFLILHDTTLRMAPLTVDIRFLPGGRYAVRGARGQRFVRRPVPFLGVGAGLNFWRYEEFGDFVDASVDPPVVFFDRLTDDGAEPEAHVLAGIEFPAGPAWSFTLEGRYTWCEVTPEGPFSDLDLGKLDLSGLSLFAGGSFQF